MEIVNTELITRSPVEGVERVASASRLLTPQLCVDALEPLQVGVNAGHTFRECKE